MDMDQAAVWLAGSILTMLGFIVVIGGIIIINNILHKYWKPVKLFTFTEYPPHYTQQEEPRLNKESK